MAHRARRRRAWSYSAGQWGTTRVRAFERPARGDTLLEWYEQGAGRLVKKRVSLGVISHEAAMRRADEAVVALGKVASTPIADPLTVAALFDNYERNVTPTKGRSAQQHDRTCLALCKRSFGEHRVMATLGRVEWDRFIADRRSGRIRPAAQRGKGVRDRQVQYDLKTLLAVCNWALTVTDVHGRPLLDRNPFKGFPIPREESPQRPELSDAEYQAMLGASAGVHPYFRLALVLVHETGHRLSSVRQLQWADVDFQARTIRWRGDSDKLGFEHVTPLPDAALEALEAHRARQAAIGLVWVFPAQRGPAGPTSRSSFAKWWTTVAEEAKLAPVKRRCFHSLRRKFASELKHAPLRDLAYLGGWKSTTTVVEVYQRPDAETMQRALATRRPITSAPQSDAQLGTTIRHQAREG